MENSFIHPGLLLKASAIFFLLIVVIIIAIYRNLQVRKKEHLYLASVRDRLQDWISESIFLESAPESPSNRGL